MSCQNTLVSILLNEVDQSMPMLSVSPSHLPIPAESSLALPPPALATMKGAIT